MDIENTEFSPGVRSNGQAIVGPGGTLRSLARTDESCWLGLEGDLTQKSVERYRGGHRSRYRSGKRKQAEIQTPCSWRLAPWCRRSRCAFLVTSDGGNGVPVVEKGTVGRAGQERGGQPAYSGKFKNWDGLPTRRRWDSAKGYSIPRSDSTSIPEAIRDVAEEFGTADEFSMRSFGTCWSRGTPGKGRELATAPNGFGHLVGTCTFRARFLDGDLYPSPPASLGGGLGRPVPQ